MYHAGIREGGRGGRGEGGRGGRGEGGGRGGGGRWGEEEEEEGRWGGEEGKGGGEGYSHESWRIRMNLGDFPWGEFHFVTAYVRVDRLRSFIVEGKYGVRSPPLGDDVGCVEVVRVEREDRDAMRNLFETCGGII